MKLILSTLTAAQNVVLTKKGANGALVVVKTITINGGANVADKKTLVTPSGVVTELSDKDFDMLKETDFYKRMEKRGHIRPIEHKSEAEDTKKNGMKQKDNSAQKTDEDYADAEAKPKTGKPSDDAE